MKDIMEIVIPDQFGRTFGGAHTVKHYIDEKQLCYMEFVHQEAALPRQSMAEEMHHISMMTEGNPEVVQQFWSDIDLIHIMACIKFWRLLI